jgi:hypothetical protein
MLWPAIGFGSLWVPNCGNQSRSRVDLKTGQITKTIKVSIPDFGCYTAFGFDSVWVSCSKWARAEMRSEPGVDRFGCRITSRASSGS